VLPIFARANSALDYHLGHDAVADGVVEIGEVGERGRVDGLEARNRGGKHVLFVDGDHVVGQRQNRVITSSTLIRGKQSLVLPVSCVEQKRWSGAAAARSTGASTSSAVRRAARVSVTHSLIARRGRSADQSRIWSSIAAQQRELRIASMTCAMSDTFAARAGDLRSAASDLRYPDGATGLAIGIGGDVVSIDVFDKPATCAAYWRRLVDGAVVDGLGRGRAGSIAPGDVADVIEALRTASWTAVAPVGDGDELRVATDRVVAALLGFGGRLVHLGAAVGALDSSTRAVRRDLPPILSDRFRVVERVGVGGTKEVFRATDAETGADVAIARMPWVDVEMFDVEVGMLRSIDSDYVPRIIDAVVDDERDGYLVMEYCKGPSVASLVERGPLPVAVAGPILVAFARGLCDVHQAGVLHRDVKPDNAVVCATPSGHRLKLIDFGMSARATSASTAVGVLRDIGGTMPYMASEALHGTALDARTDVYAFGVTCFRILVGEVPVAPRGDESDFEYLTRLRDIRRHDVSRLPALPAPAGDILARMLDRDRARRPFMPEVVAAFVHAFGDRPIALAAPQPPAAKRGLALSRSHRIAIPVAAPENVVVSTCDRAPIVVVEPSGESLVTALGADGTSRWARRVDGRVTTGIRADFDGDGVREIYLAGPDRVVGLDAGGSLLYSHAIPRGANPGDPTLIAIHDRAAPRIAIDGCVVDARSGFVTGSVPYVYQGDGRQLVAARDPRGLAYNGFALQSFRGGNGTAAAIVNHAGVDRFFVAHLEQQSGRRVELVIYGPGGARSLDLVVAECRVATGDAAEIDRLSDAPLFGPQHAPLAVLGSGDTAVIIAPLVGADRSLPQSIAAFGLPDGRALWRRWLDDASTGRAVLGDVAGRGRPDVIVGTGRELFAIDAWTGDPSEPIACDGVPIAVGDPFTAGATHLFTASRDGIEIWCGAACVPGAMQWSGPRGDHWRTGTLRADGLPLGPL
jgi:hypothetical protein